MSSNDTFCSSGSSDRPFHSTPVKTKVEFVSSKILIENAIDSDNEVSDSEQTAESAGGHTTAFTGTKSLTSISQNSSFERSDATSEESYSCRPTNHLPSSAWEQWLLKKEKQRRMQLLIESEQKLKQTEEDKHLLDVKIQQKNISEEQYQKWLHAKKLELKKRREEEIRQNAKRELDASFTREKLKLMTEIQVKKWKERKLREMKLQSNVQGNAKPAKEAEEHRRMCDLAFKQWLKDHQEYRRDRYSYGYAGGIVVSYYDATSPPPPTFFNPDPWL